MAQEDAPAVGMKLVTDETVDRLLRMLGESFPLPWKHDDLIRTLDLPPYEGEANYDYCFDKGYVTEMRLEDDREGLQRFTRITGQGIDFLRGK